MSGEMIRRVADAIQAKCKERGFNECPAPLIHHVSAAAIAAMREPTEAMADAGAIETDSEEDAIECWNAMIDEALREDAANVR